MNIVLKYYSILLKKNFVSQLLILLIGGYLITVLTAPIVFLFGSDLKAGNLTSEKITSKSLFAIVIIAPLIETLINQYCVYEILNKYNYFKTRKFLIFLISAFSFGALHYYSITYMVWGFFFGLYLVVCYDFFKFSNRKAYWLTFLIHSIRNLSALLLTSNF